MAVNAAVITVSPHFGRLVWVFIFEETAISANRWKIRDEDKSDRRAMHEDARSQHRASVIFAKAKCSRGLVMKFNIGYR